MPLWWYIFPMSDSTKVIRLPTYSIINDSKLVSTCAVFDPPNIHDFKHIFHISIYIYISCILPHPTSFHILSIFIIFPSQKPSSSHHFSYIFHKVSVGMPTMHGTTCCLQTPEGLQAQVPLLQAVAWRTELPADPIPGFNEGHTKSVGFFCLSWAIVCIFSSFIPHFDGI